MFLMITCNGKIAINSFQCSLIEHSCISRCFKAFFLIRDTSSITVIYMTLNSCVLKYFKFSVILLIFCFNIIKCTCLFHILIMALPIKIEYYSG